MEERIEVIEQNSKHNNNYLLSSGPCQALGQMHVLTLSLSSAPLSSIHPQSPCEGGIINPTLQGVTLLLEVTYQVSSKARLSQPQCKAFMLSEKGGEDGGGVLEEGDKATRHHHVPPCLQLHCHQANLGFPLCPSQHHLCWGDVQDNGWRVGAST